MDNPLPLGGLMNVGVIIGRFQVHDLHEGHITLLNKVLSKHGQALVLIGVRPSVPTQANPLSYSTRAAFFKRFSTVTTMPVTDMASDKAWSAAVDRAIFTVYGPTARATIYRGPEGFTGYQGAHTVETLDVKVDVSGTKIRERAINNPIHIGNPAFTEGIIHGIGTLAPRTLLSVDMAMVRPAVPHIYLVPDEILMGKKHGEDLWRFPGGMVDEGESFQQAAAREFVEEASLYADGWAGWKYVGDFNIKDWRIADAPEITHKSVLMTAHYTHGIARAGDDLAEVDWMPFWTNTHHIVPEHQEMWRAISNFHGKVVANA